MNSAEVLNFSNDAIIVFDRNFKIIKCNKAFLNLTGKTSEEMLGMSLLIYIPELLDLKLEAPYIIEKSVNDSHLTKWIIIPLFIDNEVCDGGIVLFQENLSFLVQHKRAVEGDVSKVLPQREIIKTILTTQEEERWRIAEALHNELGQLLYAIKLKIEGLTIHLNTPKLQKLKMEIDQLLEDAIQETRSISFDLTPQLLQDFGLKEAIKELCKRISNKNLIISSHVFPETLILDPTIEIAVFRIIQELVNNIIKHSQADKAEISVVAADDSVELIVIDNGGGFDVNSSKSGIGIRSIKSKVELFNGTFDLVSNGKEGTRIVIKLFVQ